MGRAPILTAINNAKTSVDLVIYGLTDERCIRALINAKNAGKNVRVLLEPQPYKHADENTAAIQQLQTASVTLPAPNPIFRFTHQKTLITDQQQAIVMTFNFTHATFDRERNFALIITDPAEVNEINQVFQADQLQHQPTCERRRNRVMSGCYTGR